MLLSIEWRKNMELQTQIRKYRKTFESFRELAEKIYVTRQTISNWKWKKLPGYS